MARALMNGERGGLCDLVDSPKCAASAGKFESFSFDFHLFVNNGGSGYAG